MTEVIPIRPDNPEEGKIAYAINAIRNGELVAIPTDTLYSLVADPFNLSAVEKVFATKCRAGGHSLPLMVESIDQAMELGRHVPALFYLLAHRYWPGPVSVIVEASACVPLKVTGNTGRLAVRQPASPIALRLLARFGMPLIATSANISGHPTCSQASEVLATLGRNLALILDSPIEDHRLATTVDVTTPKWRLIREGAVLEEELREFLGE